MAVAVAAAAAAVVAPPAPDAAVVAAPPTGPRPNTDVVWGRKGRDGRVAVNEQLCVTQ